MGATKQLFMQEQEPLAPPVPKKSLFNIRQDHLSLLSQVEELDGVLTPELQEALKLTEDGFKEKAISYGFLIRRQESIADVIAAEIKRLQARKQQAEKRAELFKAMLDEGMKQFGFDKVESELLTINYRKSSPVELAETFQDDILRYAEVTFTIADDMQEEAAKAGVTEETLALFDVEPSISKKRIGEAIKAGIKVPGASMPEKKNIQIK